MVNNGNIKAKGWVMNTRRGLNSQKGWNYICRRMPLSGASIYYVRKILVEGRKNYEGVDPLKWIGAVTL